MRHLIYACEILTQEHVAALNTLNLSNNRISHIEGLSHLPDLQNLQARRARVIPRLLKTHGHSKSLKTL